MTHRGQGVLEVGDPRRDPGHPAFALEEHGRRPQPAPLAVGPGAAFLQPVAVPTSTVAHLLQFKEYAIGLEEVCRLDAQRCAADRALMEAEITELSRPQPWAKSPRAARWLGRIETAILASLIVGGYVAIDRSLR